MATPDQMILGFPYRTVEGVYGDLQKLAGDNPTIATWKLLPDAAEIKPTGQPLYRLELTNTSAGGDPNTKPTLYVQGGIHARELATSEIAAQFGEELVKHYNANDPDIRWLLDFNRIAIVPIVNPDGHKIAETQAANKISPDGTSRKNANGVDLNRNFDFEWNTLGGASDVSTDDTYRGGGAASEPETKLIQEYVRSLFGDQRATESRNRTGIFIDLHSFGNFILYPRSNADQALYAEGKPNQKALDQVALRNLGLKFGFYTNEKIAPAEEEKSAYNVLQGAGLYRTSGTADDWAYGRLGVASYTFEVGADFTDGNLEDGSGNDSIDLYNSFFQNKGDFEKNKNYFENTLLSPSLKALTYAAKAAHSPYKKPSGPESIGVSVNLGEVVAGTPVLLSATSSDQRFADSSKGKGNTTFKVKESKEDTEIPPSQNIKAARYTIDTPSWVGTPTYYPLFATDGEFDSLEEKLQAVIDTTSLSVGSHTIFVESQDADDNWGVPTATKLDIVPLRVNFTIDNITFSKTTDGEDSDPFNGSVDEVYFVTFGGGSATTPFPPRNPPDGWYDTNDIKPSNIYELGQLKIAGGESAGLSTNVSEVDDGIGAVLSAVFQAGIIGSLVGPAAGLGSAAYLLYKAIDESDHQSIGAFSVKVTVKDGRPEFVWVPAAGTNTTLKSESGSSATFQAQGNGSDYTFRVNAKIPVTNLSIVSSSLESTAETNLTLIGAAAIDGIGNELDNVIIGNDAKNTLSGLAGNDTLIGGKGDDTLIGGIGSDTMLGGVGDDIYEVDSPSDTIAENFDEGDDTVKSLISYKLGNNLERLTLIGKDAINGTGNSKSNIIIGNDNANSLYGKDGIDFLYGGGGSDILNGGLGNDYLYGGLGDDRYYIDSVGDIITEASDEGIDDTVYSSITYTLGDNLEHLTLIGKDAINGTGNSKSNIIIGNDNVNSLYGKDGIDYLYGGGGSDSLDGGTGNDYLYGGLGNDRYYVDSTNDTVVEYLNEGIDDIVYASATYTLSSNLEKLTLTGSLAVNGTGNDLGNTIIGNAASNVLDGKDGNDTLYGNAGNDTLYGGDGNDTLIGEVGADILNGGDDNDTASYLTALSGIIANLSNPQANTGDAQDDIYISIEYLEGSQYADVLIGNGQSNHIWGLGGDDYLDGLGGNAILKGGLGNDTYKIDNLETQIIEYFNQGTDDTVNASIDYTLGANLENLNLLESTLARNGTGNELNNIINGNSANNTLNGGDGNDTLYGGLGRDILTGGSGNDTFVYTRITDAGDMIMDFTVGSDKIVLTDVVNSSGWRSSNLFADGFLSTRQASAGLATLLIDPDGAAGSAYRPAPFILFSNVSAAALSSLNNFVV